ncbi:MAG: hydrogenase nickel incorporation protein HypB [Kiritimatiellae bacterium]|nr:hydrogenase nickel incorporation protein HypB [Kiritimatiellia bacterium]
MSTRQIKVYKDLMGANEEWARKTRDLLAEKKLAMLNLIGSPGSGKTTLLERMAGPLGEKLRFAVLEGDVETTYDAERLDKLGVPTSQLLTSGACHLEAKLVHHALRDLPLDELDLVIVENVGNMVCPAEFDIGEHAKVAVVSVTEGEDKPEKYPLLFREAKAVVLTKTDLLPHVPVNIEAFKGHLSRVNAAVPLFQVSALSNEGMSEWIEWVVNQEEGHARRN